MTSPRNPTHSTQGLTRHRCRTFTLLLAVGCLVALPACQSEEAPTLPAYIETGDLPQITARGHLRILIPKQGQATYLPRTNNPFTDEQELVETFAQSLNLTPVWIQTASYQDLIPSLLEGKGDIIAANFTATPKRKERLSFALPVAVVREILVTRPHDPQLKGPASLAGRELVIRRSSSFWSTATTLQQQHPTLKLTPAAEHLDTEEILDGVARGTFDLTIADSNLLTAVLAYRADLRPAFDVTAEHPVAWGMRPEAQELVAAANRFLNTAHVTSHRSATFTDDWPAIKTRGVLRVLTRNNPSTYFLWRGELLGFEYELAREFAKQHGLRVEMIVPPARDQLIPWLKEGKGDLIAASMTITDERLSEGIAFSRPYNAVSELVVHRADDRDPSLTSPKDLAGKTIAVRRSSSYWKTLEELKQSGIDLTLEAAPEELETEELIGKVAAGDYDLTVADSHIVDIELTWREDIQAAFPLGDPVSHGWGVRKDNAQLLNAVNTFFNKEYRGLFYNIAYKKYFKNPRTIRTHHEFRADRQGDLSPYDQFVKKYAEHYTFNWRLLVAQMYQESRFDPNATSWVGAQGLMQVMPRTAKSLGLTHLKDPETGIHAGVKYLSWVRDRFEPDLAVEERLWFSLASYNVGRGHVLDARRLARQLGLNPNRWFDNVEKAMLLLSRRTYARQARHGYCRGSEPVNYLREIRSRYNAYTLARTS